VPQTTSNNWDGSYTPVVLGPQKSVSAVAIKIDVPPPFERFVVLGVQIDNATHMQAIDLLDQSIRRRDGRTQSIFFVNTHTLNLAAEDPAYRQTLNAADFVFPDGTGVRWAARLQGLRVLDNLVGTDFVPALFAQTADRGYSYYMLGSDHKTITAAAEYARRTFPGWRQVGFHHGYLIDATLDAAVVDEINATRPDALLVGMGNPLQERWIHEHLPRLNAPLCLGIGGLFDYWAGNVSRAPCWLRRLGHEWLWRLYQQPLHKARRYLVGNPLFLARVLRERHGS
jgi:N-acetylglucosaminyldiphosphoundecaprenol N-acetyl-beta-D-mannosaminyltransferase